MAKFDVTIHYQMPEETTYVLVDDADSEEEARELAIQEFFDRLDWYQYGAEIVGTSVELLDDKETNDD